MTPRSTKKVNRARHHPPLRRYLEYLLPSAFDTKFKYSRFDLKKAARRDASQLTGAKRRTAKHTEGTKASSASAGMIEAEQKSNTGFLNSAGTFKAGTFKTPTLVESITAWFE